MQSLRHFIWFFGDLRKTFQVLKTRKVWVSTLYSGVFANCYGLIVSKIIALIDEVIKTCIRDCASV